MDNELVNTINNLALKVFSSITLIDIKNDLVTIFECKDSLQVSEACSYESYYEKLKKIIHPDFLNSYFGSISLNTLKDSKDNYIYNHYLKLSQSLSYDNFMDVIKLLDNDQILVLSLKSGDSKPKVKVNDNNEVVSELIISLEKSIENINTSDYEFNNVVKYITELLNDVKRKNPEVLKKYQEKITIDVNKTHYSLLVVDDDNMTRNIFKKVFEDSYNIIEAKNGEEAVEIIENTIVNVKLAKPENIVGIFLDLKMPVMDGFGVLNFLQEKSLLSKVPVIIISADDAKETKEVVYGYEIADMIEKPFNFDLIKKRVSNMVSMYAKSNYLNEIVRSQDKELKKAIRSFTSSYLIDYKDNYRLAEKYYKILLEKYNEVNNVKNDIDSIVNSIKYYDLGLGTVPKKYIDNIKNLSMDEKKVLLEYPVVGKNIIKYIMDSDSDAFVKYVMDIVSMHNERFDGLGFPNGLKDKEIPYYVYLANISIEYATQILFRKSSHDEIYKTIIEKVNSKYPESIIEIFKASFDALKVIS